MRSANLNDTWIKDFITINHGTGAALDADDPPIAYVFRDAEDTPMAYLPVVEQRGALTGHYRVIIDTAESNGFMKDKNFNVIVVAVVSSVTTKRVLDSFKIEDKMEKLTNVAALITDIPVPDSFTPTVDPLDLPVPASMADTFGANSDYPHQDDYLAGYDEEAKAWKPESIAPDDVKSEVSLYQDVVNEYDAAHAEWKANYDLQRIIQWKAYVAGQLIEATE
jgi:hypothetical protein